MYVHAYLIIRSYIQEPCKSLIVSTLMEERKGERRRHTCTGWSCWVPTSY